MMACTTLAFDSDLCAELGGQGVLSGLEPAGAAGRTEKVRGLEAMPGHPLGQTIAKRGHANALDVVQSAAAFGPVPILEDAENDL